MSAMTTGSSARVLTPAPRRSTPLRLVPQVHARAAKTPFVVVVVALLAAGLLGLLVLNTLVAQNSFALHDLSKQGKQLAQREQELTGQVQALLAPQALAARATDAGMVAGGPPAFLRLSDGAVLGQPTVGVAPVLLAPVVAQPSAAPKASTAPKASAAPKASTAPKASAAPKSGAAVTPSTSGAHR